MNKHCLLFPLIAAASVMAAAADSPSADLAGVKVALNAYQGPATLRVEMPERFKLRVSMDTGGETKALALRVELPASGPGVWPWADVEVRDANGKALLVQRTGIEWWRMLVPLPAGMTTCFVQAMEPKGGWPKPTSDKDRAIQDSSSGLRLRIAKWHDGRSAALSIRFDDSHPTHLTKAVPLLREHGFRGTFMICPGASEPGSRRKSDFEEHRSEWEALAKQGDHEFANHSAHHRGGFGDEDMEAEVGGAAQAIWKLTPGRSKLMALNLGGGTRWDTTRTLRYYLDKYHLFDASENSTGMDDSYGNRVENFRRILEQHVQRGLWCRIHYHYIGDGLSSSEANFRAAMNIAKEHAASLWIAGMADIHKYQTERNAAKLTLLKSDARQISFQLSCATDPTLYDRPLTLEVAPPSGWNRQEIVIKDSHGMLLPARPGAVEGIDGLRFDVPAREGVFSIRNTP
jgi:peptidoglycan/xylan/chitin deacetylase (PgdA/CDA1 family)